MKEFIVNLINKDDNKSFDVEFKAENLNEAWLFVAGLCVDLNSVCDELKQTDGEWKEQTHKARNLCQ